MTNGTDSYIYPNKYFNINNATTTKQIFANDRLIATIEGNGTATSTYYTHSDHLGGSSVITDNTGTLTQTLDYYPFGGIRINEKEGSFDEKRKFTGHEYDDATGLNYMNARYQSGNVGRFISIDSESRDNPEKFLADPQQMNSYSYARNNPIIYNDPSGKCIWDACAIEGVAAIGVADIVMQGLAVTSAGLLIQQALQKSNWVEPNIYNSEPGDDMNLYPNGMPPNAPNWKKIGAGVIGIGTLVGGKIMEMNEFKDSLKDTKISDQSKDREEVISANNKQEVIKADINNKQKNTPQKSNVNIAYPKLKSSYQSNLSNGQNKQKQNQQTYSNNNQVNKKPEKKP